MHSCIILKTRRFTIIEISQYDLIIFCHSLKIFVFSSFVNSAKKIATFGSNYICNKTFHRFFQHITLIGYNSNLFPENREVQKFQKIRQKCKKIQKSQERLKIQTN